MSLSMRPVREESDEWSGDKAVELLDRPDVDPEDVRSLAENMKSLAPGWRKSVGSHGELVFMSTKPICKRPEVIGYWARMEGLTLTDCLEHGALSPHLQGEERQLDFQHGWHEADAEVRHDKFQSLFHNLREAYDWKKDGP